MYFFKCKISVAIRIMVCNSKYMSLPDEKYRALIRARDFLRELLDPSKTKRVPKAIRQEAYYALKHYPWDYDIERMAKKCPEIIKAPEGKK